MIKLHGAVVKEQDVTFAIVVVKQDVLNSPFKREDAQRAYALNFPGMPIILMAQDSRGIPKYWGRRDVVKFLANVHPSRIPWKKFTF